MFASKSSTQRINLCFLSMIAGNMLDFQMQAISSDKQVKFSGLDQQFQEKNMTQYLLLRSSDYEECGAFQHKDLCYKLHCSFTYVIYTMICVVLKVQFTHSQIYFLHFTVCGLRIPWFGVSVSEGFLCLRCICLFCQNVVAFRSIPAAMRSFGIKDAAVNKVAASEQL